MTTPPRSAVSERAADGPLRILIPTETYPPEISGAGLFAQRLATGLADRGHDVHVVCPSASGIASHDVEDGVRVHRLAAVRWPFHPSWTISPPWSAPRAFAGLLAQIDPDVVHSQAHFVIGRSALRQAHRAGIPLVATNHFMPDNVRPYVRAPQPLLDLGVRAAYADLRACFELADRFTVPTQLAADLLAANGFSAPVEAVSCGIDLSRFDSQHRLPAAERAELPPRVLFVGRLSKEKHAEDIVAALAKTDPALGIEARFIGSGDQDSVLRDLADDLGLADRVRVLGKVSEQTLVDELASATVFCMPSTAELQSIATLEALASGLPVVLADAVALPHLVDEGRNGTLFPPRDVDALAAALAGVVTAGPEALEDMGAHSRTVAARHDIRRTLSRFEEIYRDVIAARASAARG